MSGDHALQDSDWLTLLAPDRLEDFLRGALRSDANLSIRGRAENGSSNITAFVEFGDERLVVRRPPRGELLPTAHDMMREAKFLRALDGTAVPIPRLRAVCEDKAVIGAPFHVTEEIDGLVLQQEEPTHLRAPEHLHDLCDHVVTCLAEIHAVDWNGRGLPGRPDGYIQRQIARWSSQLELTPSAARLSGLAEVAPWLVDHVPAQLETTIVHGDYGLHNMVLDRHSPRVLAILDWEMATLGDPLADLVWFLQGWGHFEAGVGNPANYITTWSGCLSRDEMLEVYARKTGRTLKHEKFYRIFSMWKSIVVNEGLYSAYLNGEAANPAVARFEIEVPARVDAVREQIRGGE